MLDLVGVATTYRFKLGGLPPVTGARGLRRTVAAQRAKVIVNGRGEATSVTISGRTLTGTYQGVAIFYRQDLDAHPYARQIADAAEREWALLLRPATQPAAPI